MAQTIGSGVRAVLTTFLRTDLDLEALRRYDRPVLFILGGRRHPNSCAQVADPLASVFADFLSIATNVVPFRSRLVGRPFQRGIELCGGDLEPSQDTLGLG